MHTNRIRLLFLSVCLGCLFLCSCGLDEYYVIDPPTATEINSEDVLEMVYRFTCKPLNAVTSSQITMHGTAVYFKVYTDEDRLNTEKKTIDGANSEFSDSGYNKLKGINDSEGATTATYQNMEFKTTPESEIYSFYIPPSSSETRWQIEFYPDLDTETKKALILKNQDGTSSDTRYIFIEKPTSGGKVYVNAYAVAEGENLSWVPVHSSLAALGVLQFEIE